MIPASVKAVLWSYDSSKINLNKDKGTIIQQVLNLGSKEAISWLFKTYEKDEIVRVASKIPASSWNKKSLTLWSLVLGINPPKKRLLS